MAKRLHYTVVVALTVMVMIIILNSLCVKQVKCGSV